jgi:signal transduction histidine kinase
MTWRRDLALPVVVGGIELIASRVTYDGRFFTGSARPGAAAHPSGLDMVLHMPNGHLSPLDWALAAAGPVALGFRRRHPVAVAWVTCAVTLAPSVLWFGYLSLIVAVASAATAGHRRAAWAVIAAGYVSSMWVAPLAWHRPIVPAGPALFVAAWLAVLVIGAEVLRMRRERRAEAAATRQLDARRRAGEERLRMARELHDVIGHNISLINIQAGVGLDLMDSQPEQARAALAAVRAVSGQALDELRAMLSALRESGEKAPRSPAPGLGRLPELISLTSAAGMAVTTSVSGEPRELPAAVDLAAYRIVQESLTNVARHAGPATVTVLVGFGEDDLSLEIADDGRGAPRPGPPFNGTPGDRPAGTGIPGMRERAAALGGNLDAGPRPGRGFLVSARLPLCLPGTTSPQNPPVRPPGATTAPIPPAGTHHVPPGGAP